MAGSSSGGSHTWWAEGPLPSILATAMSKVVLGTPGIPESENSLSSSSACALASSAFSMSFSSRRRGAAVKS